MKKLLTILATLALCLPALPQGHIGFGNDAGHLIVLSSNPAFLPPDWSSLAGLAVPQMGSASAQNMGMLTAQILYGSTFADVTQIGGSFNGAGIAGFADGRLANRNMTIPALSGGVAAFFQIRIYQTDAGSYEAASSGLGFLYGSSPVFSSIPGASLPNSIVLVGPPSFSTWATLPIMLSANSVPEPTTLTMAALGFGLLVFCIRRK
jgi:hypothetical protein